CLGTLVLIGGFLLVVSMLGRNNDRTTSTPPTAVSSDIRPQAGRVIPKSEQAFIDVIESFQRQYEDAPNELKKSALRTKRAHAIATVLSRFGPPRRWVGTIGDLG